MSAVRGVARRLNPAALNVDLWQLPVAKAQNNSIAVWVVRGGISAKADGMRVLGRMMIKERFRVLETRARFIRLAELGVAQRH
jgi:hypothetical protein